MDAELTRDDFLGGALKLWQPRKGYRAGIDPVLLAASVPAQSGQTVLDLGCGVGAAALCLSARVAGLVARGIERHPLYADLARKNGLDCLTGDIAQLPRELRQASFDHVIANPPYFDRRMGHGADDPAREAALGEETPIEIWIDVAARRLRPKGYLSLIHRSERLPDVLSALDGRLGSIELKPISPRAGRDAELFLLRARKEGRAPFVLHAPLVLHAGARHESDAEDYTPEIIGASRQGKALVW